MTRIFNIVLLIAISCVTSVVYAGEAMQGQTQHNHNNNSFSGMYMGITMGSVKAKDSYIESRTDNGNLSGYTYDGAERSSLQGILFGVNTQYLSALGLVLGAEAYLENRDTEVNELDRLSGTPDADFSTITKSKYSGTLSARIGYPISPKMLIYSSLGRTFTSMERIYINRLQNLVDNRNTDLYGYTKAFGMEYKISDSMNARIEHSKTDYHDDFYISSAYNSAFVQKGVGVQDESLKFSLIFEF